MRGTVSRTGLWKQLTTAEIEAYTAAVEAPEADVDRWRDVEFPDTGDDDAPWHSWFARFVDAMPRDGGPVYKLDFGRLKS